MFFWKKILLSVLFFIFLGFAGGGIVLLEIIVPFESKLQNAGISQTGINVILIFIILLWVICSGFLTLLYLKKTVNTNRSYLASFLLFSVIASSVFVFQIFINTGNDIISSVQGKPKVLNDQYQFGPYPVLDDLKKLKKEGYTDVISLLSPAIPFENQLLSKEKKSAKSAGITLHSFPMLPWILNNDQSLQSIKELIEQNPEKHFYIHCYLGKHRAIMVERVIDSHTTVAVSTVPNKLERGSLVSFEKNKILLGPYPTDEEWMNVLLLGQIQEVVSTLNPDNPDDVPWIEETRKICEEHDIAFVSRPIDPDTPNPADVKDLVLYAQQSDHPLYIFDFLNGNRFNALNDAFSMNNKKLTKK